MFLVAFAARTANFRIASAGGPIGPFDDLYHAYRIAYSASHPGRVLGFDPQRGISGAFCPWPPLYDMLAGAAARLLGGTSLSGVLGVVVWFPPIFASCFAAFLTILLARWRGVFLAVLGGAALAIAPSGIHASRFGAIDHHFLEPMLIVAILACTIRLLRVQARPAAAADAALFASAVSVALLVQVALLVAAGLACLAILVLAERREPSATAALGFATAAGVVLGYHVLQPDSYPVDEWHLGVPHFAALVGAAAACATSALLTHRVTRIARVAAAIAAGALLACAIPPAATAFLEGSRFLGGDPWLATIEEFQPLFMTGWKGAPGGLLELGGGLLLACVWLTGRLGRPTRETLVLALFATAYVAATITSQRFLICAATLLALWGAVTANALRPRRASAAIAAALLLLPWLARSMPEFRGKDPNMPAEARPFLRAAREISKRGTGKILCPWSWGHVFHVVGGQSVLVDGFGAMIGRGQFENALGAILVAREEFLADYCRRYGVRWIVLENPVTYLSGQVQAIGLSPLHFLVPGKPARLTPRMRFTFWWRAYFDRGGAVREPGHASPAFRQFRLIYSDPQLSAGPARFRGPMAQVWELVGP